MCLYPRLIKNPRYIPNKKNKGRPPKCTDIRKLYVPTGCGNCIECRKQKARQWQVRLTEELKVHKYNYFTTLTFSNEKLAELMQSYDLCEGNAIAGKAVRLFLERWRKKYKKSLTHWFITERGHTGTERIHLHGVIFSDTEITNEELQKYWQYGYTDTGEYCNNRSINYIVKYVTKIDLDHKTFKADIFCSAGLGKAFTENEFYQNVYKYKPHNTPEWYALPNGQKLNLPIYYRNKFYDEPTRENMWTDLLDKDTRYVRGIEIQNASKNENLYFNILRQAQDENERLGYGNRDKEWQKEPYNITLRMLNAHTHVKDARVREQHELADIADVTGAPSARPSTSYNIETNNNITCAEIQEKLNKF